MGSKVKVTDILKSAFLIDLDVLLVFCNFGQMRSMFVSNDHTKYTILKIEQRIQYKLISFTYKILIISQPTDLHNLISLQSDNNTCSSDVFTLARPSPASSLNITDRSLPCLISGINFHFRFVNQFQLFMLTSIHPSVLHFLHPSPLHSSTLNSRVTFLVNLFHHRSRTVDTSDWLLG